MGPTLLLLIRKQNSYALNRTVVSKKKEIRIQLLHEVAIYIYIYSVSLYSNPARPNAVGRSSGKVICRGMCRTFHGWVGVGVGVGGRRWAQTYQRRSGSLHIITNGGGSPPAPPPHAPASGNPCYISASIDPRFNTSQNKAHVLQLQAWRT